MIFDVPQCRAAFGFAESSQCLSRCEDRADRRGCTQLPHTNDLAQLSRPRPRACGSCVRHQDVDAAWMATRSAPTTTVESTQWCAPGPAAGPAGSACRQGADLARDWAQDEHGRTSACAC